MYRNLLCPMLIVGSLLAPTALPSAAHADPSNDRFNQAYYLEKADGDWSAAAKLYEQVAGDRRAGSKLRARATVRLAVCREELASSDLARLMPPDTWAYAELNRPGDRVLRLLQRLGLAADADRAIEQGGKRVAISPALIKEILGIRGLAVAITGFDPVAQMPAGVLVFHAGSVEVVRGLIETALPVGGTAVDSIAGHATFEVEEGVLVTLTKRLVIASRDRVLISGVIDRMEGREKRSLASNEALADVRHDSGDSLLMFMVNVKPLMPMIKGALAMGAMKSREVAMASALLDPESLESFSGRLGVDDDGIHFDVGLRLAEGHHNLAFNLLRTPGINPKTLKSIPAGAAAVIVGALNDARSKYSSGSSADGGTSTPVSLLDFGREVFANITSLGVFVMPPDGDAAASGPPIPDVAAVFTVNDPAKTESIWTTVLGVASMAAGGAPVEGAKVELDGVSARSFSFPNGITAYVAASGSNIVISPSRLALQAAVDAGRKGRSLVDDPAFAAALKDVGKDTTKIVMIHAGRAIQVAQRIAPPGALDEAAEVLPLLKDTVLSWAVDYSDRSVGISANLNGIPDVGDVVANLVAEEMNRGKRHARAPRRRRSGTSVEGQSAKRGAKNDDVGDKADAATVESLLEQFDKLAVEKKDRKAAAKCAKQLYRRIEDDALALNNFAWGLLTEDQYGHKYDRVARTFSRRSNKLTDHDNWAFLDTLALAEFHNGHAAKAVKIELKAIELCDGSGLAELKKALARFEAGVKKTED